VAAAPGSPGGKGDVTTAPAPAVEKLAMQAAYLMEPCRSEYATGLCAQAVCQADQGDNGLRIARRTLCWSQYKLDAIRAPSASAA
jgi:hypothetical protein